MFTILALGAACAIKLGFAVAYSSLWADASAHDDRCHIKCYAALTILSIGFALVGLFELLHVLGRLGGAH